MGLFSQIITRILVNKVEETITTNASNNQKNKNGHPIAKIPLFQSLEESMGFYVVFFLSIQSVYTLILVACKLDSLSWIVLSGIYATSVLISLVLFINLLIAYSLHLINLLPFLSIIIPLQVILLLASTSFEWAFWKDFIIGGWMSPLLRIILFLLGIINNAAGLSYLLYLESDESHEKIKKPYFSNTSKEEKLRICASLIHAIQENSISIHFPNRQCGFSRKEDVLFGFDKQNRQFVFVNENKSHILASHKVIYLDFEDITPSPDNSPACPDEYQRLIKLYYLGSNQSERVISFEQVHTNDEYNQNINVIKYHANGNPTCNPEIVFRRKMRHLASSLEKDFYPCRPFINDRWFDILKETMEKIKNNKTDGYSLFRESVIANDDYLDDGTLFTILCDMSNDPPNKKSAKKEAKKLCLDDFGKRIKKSITGR